MLVRKIYGYSLKIIHIQWNRPSTDPTYDPENLIKPLYFVCICRIRQQAEISCSINDRTGLKKKWWKKNDEKDLTGDGFWERLVDRNQTDEPIAPIYYLHQPIFTETTLSPSKTNFRRYRSSFLQPYILFFRPCRATFASWSYALRFQTRHLTSLWKEQIMYDKKKKA